MKELPYFRFTVAEWLQGDISLEDYQTKGFFIDLCAFYWFNDCELEIDKIYKRFPDKKDCLENLLLAKIVKQKNNLLEINFLKNQMKNLRSISEKRSNSGKIGGLSRVANAKQMLKQMPEVCLSYKDKDKDKEKDKKDKDIFSVVTILNDILGTSFKPNSKSTQGHISARLSEGFTVDQFEQVIRTKYGQWHNDPKMKSFLRPETLFGTKFESYLNESKLIEKKVEEKKPKEFLILQEQDEYYQRLGYDGYLAEMTRRGIKPMLDKNYEVIND